MLMIGSKVRTPDGERRIQTLRVGDLVETRDNSVQPIRWIGQRQFAFPALMKKPHLTAIMVEKDAIAPNVPNEELYLSRENRLSDEGILKAASSLQCTRADTDSCYADYFHLLFDQSEVIFVNGLEVESFHPAQPSFEGADTGSRLELFETFPDLAKLPNIFGKASGTTSDWMTV